ncbi:Fibronectin type III domain protein [Minicystis rosea]|nr:Fibronectin type III domain protein [Minicystis rosea]
MTCMISSKLLFAPAATLAALSLVACSGDGETTNTGGQASTGTSMSVGGSGGSGGGGSPVIPAKHPRIYLNEANRARLTASLDGAEKAATRFRDMVDDQLENGDVYAFQAYFAALLGVLTKEPAYCKYAVEDIDARVAAEEALIAAGESAEVAGDSYLYVGETVGDLALVHDWCFDATTAAQRTRWIAYANQAVWNVWHPEEASWGGVSHPWSGWSIDNPSNNYYYSFLRATLLLGLTSYGEHDSAQTWIDTFREEKIQKQLVPTFTSDLEGGGSREGTGYGVSMRSLFQLYDLWEATTGERIWDLTGHTRASLPNLLAFTVPTLDRIAPIGDHARDSTAALFDYHRSYVLTLAHLLGPSDPLSDVAQTWLDDCSVPEMEQRFMFLDDFLYYDPMHAKRPLSDLHPTYYAPGTGSVFFRDGWSKTATWGAFLAGPFTESHAHRDQGSLLVYRGEWLAYDENILSHSGLRQEEESHNLVRIQQGGATVTMANGAAKLSALHDTKDLLYLRADVTPVYAGKAAVSRVEREVLFFKGPGAFLVMDRVDTSDGAEAVWQLNAPSEPTPLSTTGWAVSGAAGTLRITPLYPASPTAAVLDWPSLDSDLNGGYRLDVSDPAAGGKTRYLMLLAPGGNVSSSTPVPGATTVGATLSFSDGTTAEVSFGKDTAGGTLTLSSSASLLFEGALPGTIDTLPLFDVVK